jgi:hypothetical protein
MSQYPSPYPAPGAPQPQQVPAAPYGYNFDYYQPYGQPTGDPLGPARRAGMLMYVLGGLLAVVGACNGVSSLATSPQQILQQQAEFMPAGQQSPLSPEATRTMAVVFAVLTLGLGIGLILLGTWVRRGSLGAAWTGIVLTGGAVLLLLLMVLATIVAGASGSPILFVATCVFVIPLALFGLQLVWLIQAARAAPRVAAMRNHQQNYQAQLWQYQQQQQQPYAQGGYATASAPMQPSPYGTGGAPQGYATAPPPPPQATPPPPAPPPPPAGGNDDGPAAQG